MSFCVGINWHLCHFAQVHMAQVFADVSFATVSFGTDVICERLTFGHLSVETGVNCFRCNCYAGVFWHRLTCHFQTHCVIWHRCHFARCHFIPVSFGTGVIWHRCHLALPHTTGALLFLVVQNKSRNGCRRRRCEERREDLQAAMRTVPHNGICMFFCFCFCFVLFRFLVVQVAECCWCAC